MFVYNKEKTAIGGGMAMKLRNQKIDMISWTSKEGIVTPVRFRLEEGGESIVIRINRVIQTEKTLFSGTPTLLFRCSSIIHGTETIYELAYHCSDQCWLLKKM